MSTWTRLCRSHGPAPLLPLGEINGAGKPGFDDGVAAMARYPIRDRLVEIDCPTLIVWGELDRLVPLRDAAEFEWSIRDARKIVYDDTGHAVMLESPERFNDDLRGFVEEPSDTVAPWQPLRKT